MKLSNKDLKFLIYRLIISRTKGSDTSYHRLSFHQHKQSERLFLNLKDIATLAIRLELKIDVR